MITLPSSQMAIKIVFIGKKVYGDVRRIEL
jgi:hypothetical protein